MPDRPRRLHRVGVDRGEGPLLMERDLVIFTPAGKGIADAFGLYTDVVE